jgi:hypothetical protein
LSIYLIANKSYSKKTEIQWNLELVVLVVGRCEKKNVFKGSEINIEVIISDVFRKDAKQIGFLKSMNFLGRLLCQALKYLPNGQADLQTDLSSPIPTCPPFYILSCSTH